MDDNGGIGGLPESGAKPIRPKSDPIGAAIEVAQLSAQLRLTDLRKILSDEAIMLCFLSLGAKMWREARHAE